MRNILLVTTILSFTATATFAALDEAAKKSCAEMGYNSTVDGCLAEGGTPLLCPFSETDENSCVCLKESCRGYNLLKDSDGSYYYLSSDGTKVSAVPTVGTVESNIVGDIESCVVGFDADAITYYRVPECKEGYLYQNNICDIGCDTTSKYPYNYHPGNLPGIVEMCKNESGEWYGYTSCNSGWTLKDGKCNLNDCDIKNYPYNTDPNAKKVRGTTETCRIGGNPYYKYTSCNDGYELKKSICVGSCEIDVDNCTSTAVNINAANYPYSYNDWKCPLVDKDSCMIGDNATINGKSIGTVFYISEDKILVMGDNRGAIRWGNGLAESTDIPTEILPNITSTALAVQDYDGKQKTNAIKAYVHSSDSDEFNDSGCTTSVTDALCSYPAATKCYNYSTTNCNHNMCQQGEWYLPALGELGYMYDNRYILYNVTGSTVFTNSYFWSSTEYSSTHAWLVPFGSGNRPAWDKGNMLYVRPVLAF